MRNLLKCVLLSSLTLSLGTAVFPQQGPQLQELGKPAVKISISPTDPTERDMISFTVHAQDTSMTGLKRIVLLVNGREVKVCLMSPCAFIGGPYAEGTLKFEAKVFDHTGNEPWTGHRMVTVRSRPLPAGPPKRMIDLLSLAGDGRTRWTNGLIDLPFPGDEDELGSFASYRHDAVLEDGQVREKVLLTRPQIYDEKEIVIGIFKIENLPPNSAFRAKVGFLEQPDRTDGAEFTVLVSQDPSFFASKLCFYDGRMDDLLLDLRRYSGQDVDIVLQVRGLTTQTRHLAVWVDPRIEW